MKKILLTFIFVFSLTFALFALTDVHSAERVAKRFLSNKTINTESVSLHTLLSYEDSYYIFNLNPQGFIIISAYSDIEPVLAYSFYNNFTSNNAESKIIKEIINHIQASLRQENPDSFLERNIRDDDFQQWPPAGQTVTGGWIQTQWHQNIPFNDMCPIDPSTGNRSVAGCPSISVAQILNYHRKINNTQFNYSDRYHMFSGTNNNYFIDDTHNLHDYPDFETLNTYLNDINNLYQSDNELNNQQKATLVYASGVAIKQAYSSSISGNYFSLQVLNSYHRFGFTGASMLKNNSPLLIERIIDNMKNGLPAQLCLVNSQGAGHQVVIDGYNSLNKLHLNFGWGGQSDGWYNLPLSGMPVQLNIIDAVILDINQDLEYYPDFDITIYDNSDNLMFSIDSNDNQITNYQLYIDDTFKFETSNSGSYSISLSAYLPGIYKLKVYAFYNNGQIRVIEKSFEIHRGELVFSENFDQGFSDWAISGSNSIWQNLNSSFQSFSDYSEDNIYSAVNPVSYTNVNSRLVSPEIHLPEAENIKLSFFAAYSDAYLSYPNLKLYVLSNSGSNRDLVWEAFNDNDDWKWHLINVDISAYAEEVIKLEFHTQGFSYCDIAVDNINIYKDSFVRIYENFIMPIQDLSVYPNPFNYSNVNSKSNVLNIRFDLNNAGKASIEVFDVKGRKIKQILNDYLTKGQYTYNWNFQNEKGRSVSSGIYFIKVNSQNYSRINKIVYMK